MNQFNGQILAAIKTARENLDRIENLVLASQETENVVKMNNLAVDLMKIERGHIGFVPVGYPRNPLSVNGCLSTVVTGLTMNEHPVPARKRQDLPSSEGDRAMINLKDFPAQVKVILNRYWYNRVGRPCFWYERNTQSDVELHKYLRHPWVDFFVLLVAGMPAGFVELDHRTEGVSTLALFGLFPHYYGKGHGKWMLDWVVDYVYRDRVYQKFVVSTNSLDHVAALPNYKRAGFEVVGQHMATYIDPRVIWPAESQRFDLSDYPWSKTDMYTHLYREITTKHESESPQ